MPKPPSDMPLSQNDCQQNVANDAAVDPKAPSPVWGRVWTDAEFDDPFMIAPPVTTRPNALRRCRPGVTGHQGRLDTRCVVVTGYGPEPILVEPGHSIAL